MHTAIVAHDAGGAEILSSWVRRQGKADQHSFVLAGPAMKVFERKLGRIECLPLDQALAQSDRVLTGTGWQATLERNGLALAAERGLPSAAFIDHWVNYRERFACGAGFVWPDEFWLGDEIGLDLARRLLPERPHRLVANPYFADLRDEIAASPQRAGANNGALSILYVCEPIAEHALKQFGDARHWGYTEHDALRFFLDSVGRLGQPVEGIVIRRHPAEAADKYLALVDGIELPLTFGGQRSLVDEVCASDVVVGCASMAMVVGLLAGKRVLSTIPPGGGACALPHPEVAMLRDLR